MLADGDAKQPSSSSSGSNAAGTSGQVAITSHDGAIIYAGTRGAVMVLRRADLALLDVVKVWLGMACTRFEWTCCGA